MVPTRVAQHLRASGIRFSIRSHDRAVTAQRLAASMHVSGHRVAKSVLVEAEGKRLIAVLRGADVVNVERLGRALGALSVRLMSETEFAPLFAECDAGAEPPFGSLYGLPVVVDWRLARSGPIILRAGSHEEVLEMFYDDFIRLEHPMVADFADPMAETAAADSRESWMDEDWLDLDWSSGNPPDRGA